MKNLLIGMITCVLSIVSGCATITTGTDQSVTVITEKKVNGAKCELNDSNGGKWFISDTPGTVNVRKGYGPMSIECNKEGYVTTVLSVDEVFAGATLGNILLGGGIGIFIDAMSGSAQKYPDEIVIWMEPENWDSDEEKLAWFKAKEEYEAELLAKQKALEESTKAPIGNLN